MMKKKLVLLLLMIATTLCLLAVSASASTIYKDENGTKLFEYEAATNKVITSYEGAFPKTDSEGNALVWYVDSTKEEGSDTVITVKSFKTLGDNQEDGIYGKIDDKGWYSVIGVLGKNIVSINLPNNSGIKLVNVDFNGGYTGTFPRESNILFAYFPNTLEDYVTNKNNGGGGWVVERLFQYTPILECYFSDLDTSNENHMKGIGNFDFYGCKNMRKCVLPNGITTIYGHKDHNSGPAFRECTSLTEIVIPNTVTSIGPKAFESCSALTTIYLGANSDFTFVGDTVTGQIFSSTGNLKKVYLSNTFDTAASRMFVSSAHNAVFFYAGSYEEYLTFNEALKTAGSNERFTDATPILWDSTKEDSYYTDLATSEGKRYVVYGYNKCNAFYGGEHKNAESETMKFVSYFEPITYVCACENGCGNEIVNESKTIPAIFTYRGYSCTEKAINGFHSMTQAYSVDTDALAEYKKINPEFKYGLVASGYANPLDESVDASKVVNYPNEKFAREYFEIKVQGISGNNMEKAVVFCLYVIDNGTYYLDNNTVSETVTGISFNELHAIKYPTEEGEAV